MHLLQRHAHQDVEFALLGDVARLDEANQLEVGRRRHGELHRVTDRLVEAVVRAGAEQVWLITTFHKNRKQVDAHFSYTLARLVSLSNGIKKGKLHALELVSPQEERSHHGELHRVAIRLVEAVVRPGT